MPKYQNRLVKNRKSPGNERAYISAYGRMVPGAIRKGDGQDICAVTTINGEKGHAIMNQSINRSHDKGVHVGKKFISDKELRNHMK